MKEIQNFNLPEFKVLAKLTREADELIEQKEEVKEIEKIEKDLLEKNLSHA